MILNKNPTPQNYNLKNKSDNNLLLLKDGVETKY
jgi:hypothetical protein